MDSKKILVVAILLLVLKTGPGWAAKPPECVKAGVRYGVVEGNFAEAWYSYQERGESYLAGECWDPARADFEQAIKLRTAMDKAADIPGCDQRRARSYGMHFEDWFGHRGLGVALLQLGQVDNAIRELELSLQCTESSQAQFYLDKARAKKLESSGADTESPKIVSARLLRSEPKRDYLKTGAPGPAAGYDRFLAVPYYFTLEAIVAIKADLSDEQKRDKVYLKSLTPGWGSLIISWRSADEISDQAVRDGKFYILIESADDQGVQIVAANGAESPYTFAQKTRADVFPLELKTPAGEEPKPEGAPDAANEEPTDLFVIALDEAAGTATVNIVVTDLLGKKGESRVALVIDREGPQVSIEEFKKTGDQAEVRGVIEDRSGIKSFTVGGVAAKINGSQFEVTAPLSAAAEVSFAAADKIGNQTTGVISLTPPEGAGISAPRRFARWLDRVIRLASRAGLAELGLISDRPAPFSAWTAEPDPCAAASDSAVRFAPEAQLCWTEVAAAPKPPAPKPPAAAPKPPAAPAPKPPAAPAPKPPAPAAPAKPPQVVLKTKPQSVYTAQLAVAGSAAAQGGLKLKTIVVAGTNVLQSSQANAFFNKAVSLQAGVNKVKIIATDVNGQKTEQVIAITRIVPQVVSVAERLPVGMLPFYQDPKYIDIGGVAYDNLATALIQQKRFRYVDRTKIDAILRELKLTGAGLTDPATTVRAGKLTSSQAIIIGVVKETPTTIELKAQVVDVETSKVLVTQDVFHQNKSLENLRLLAAGLAIKISTAFPLVQSNIAGSQGKVVTITMGQNNRVFAAMRVIFFKIIPKTDATGQPIGADTKKIGEGKITAVSATSSTVEIIGSAAPGTNDLVITK